MNPFILIPKLSFFLWLLYTRILQLGTPYERQRSVADMLHTVATAQHTMSIDATHVRMVNVQEIVKTLQ
jgi:hypothetical protein